MVRNHINAKFKVKHLFLLLDLIQILYFLFQLKLEMLPGKRCFTSMNVSFFVYISICILLLFWLLLLCNSSYSSSNIQWITAQSFVSFNSRTHDTGIMSAVTDQLFCYRSNCLSLSLFSHSFIASLLSKCPNLRYQAARNRNRNTDRLSKAGSFTQNFLVNEQVAGLHARGCAVGLWRTGDE